MGGHKLKTRFRYHEEMEKDFPLKLMIKSLKSLAARKTYAGNYRRFLQWSGYKNGTELIAIEPKKLKLLIIQYLDYLYEKGVSPNTIPSYVWTLQNFFENNDVDLNWKKIKKYLPEPIKLTGQNAYQTEHVKKMLSITKKLQHRALIHFFAASGARRGTVFYQYNRDDKRPLVMGDLRDMPHGCKMVIGYRDTKDEFRTFLTPEAVEALEDSWNERRHNGEIFTDQTPVFLTPKGIAMTEEDVKQIIARIVKYADVRGKKVNGRYPIQMIHGFRKRFNTILKLKDDVNDNAIERMLAHKQGLDYHYLMITDEQLFNEYWKGVNELTIDSTARDKIKIRELEKKAVPDQQEIAKEIMPEIMAKLRKELGLGTYPPEIIDNLSKQELQNLVKNFMVN